MQFKISENEYINVNDDNSIEIKPQFYDPDISVEKLDLTGMFYGCVKLPSIGNLN